MLIQPGELLAKIDNPSDLRKLPLDKLYQVCEELRQYIIDNVSIYGGHFGASLGVTELSVAMHYVYNTPYDRIVWDVGHQAYNHKILTGRRDQFHTNRQYGGLSGFPKRDESEYDTFGVGHSSTSISAALGMAIASKEKGDDRQHIAVIGDGSMTAGMAFEAMNHAGASDANILIILNDNRMAIDPNQGALKDYLTDITTSPFYNKIKDEVWNMLGKVKKIGPHAQQAVSAAENALKSALLEQSNLFEALGLRYFGPVDGHDINHLVHVMEDLKKIPGPKILHAVTVKGKGYALAEKDQTKWHAPGKFDKLTGEIKKKVFTTPQAPKYQTVFGETILEMARENEKIMGITPAMPSGCSLNIMMKEMPDRAIDVGIAEQHAVTFAAGLAAEGMIPFCNIYSSFMQRAYDQVVHDVCIQNLPVIFCLDRAGFAGADGATHHGAYDIPFMRCIPNLVVAAPMNEAELRHMMLTAVNHRTSPFSIRYPRGQGVMPEWKVPMEEMQVGKGRKIKDGEEVAVLTFGHIGNYVVQLSDRFQAEGVNPAHYDMRFVKPIDEEMLQEVFTKFDKVVTIEDGAIMGGFGSAILEWMMDNGFTNKQIVRLGIPDTIIEQGEQIELQKEAGFDHDGILEAVLKLSSNVKSKSKVLVKSK
ncbi:1-deoxy-D-xylulose-5-phosphate synthase [Flammeovirga kamogawensis]|uniref:1-deoxy-D-xylulose-5-phosphate synthase n=1 Tax=Flammeovirga kamogawensis TaxID=373891 RepID=A0ABX8GS95_9BACT|nr:1-deoxy-D-xylulose-5-phosphate synthase [Flammeovirga kamogawensis]MBB6461388.1 1-deoxy-D-xylulose-5-phosphate synthase [Flammeovirga kamogawensis]QWG06288.1 1-deoxy-D-xylulose-5-phosphate synthase [Flammeovirga kamogawensis]TRX68117.1 1-deoxy-D-xylulose-5-phosphate synthase [Flammeovirga kamogawensis]